MIARILIACLQRRAVRRDGFRSATDRGPDGHMVCLYWIVKLKAGHLSGDYAEALAAADKEKALGASTVWIQLVDYFYYTALTVAALYEKGSADEQQGRRDLLTAHREKLLEWADNYPLTFADKHAPVSAEIARLEDRDLDAIFWSFDLSVYGRARF
jgi:hypothetical protein